MSILRLFPLICLSLLVGCSTLQEQTDEVKSPEKDKLATKPPVFGKEGASSESLNPDVLFMLLTAELAGQRGQYDIALEGYLEAAKRVKDPRLTERAAMIAMYMKDKGKTDEAVSLWLSQDPDNLTARKISAFSAIKTKSRQQAVEQLGTLMQQDPAGFEKSLFELAGALQKEGDIKFIYDVLEDLSQKHPNQASLVFVQTLLAADMKKFDLAETKIEQTLRLQPNWDKALILQAQLAMYAEDYVRAGLLLRNAALKYPDNEKIKKMLAQSLIKLSKFDEAQEVYESLVSANPKDNESRYALALVFLQLEKENKAEDIFKELLDIHDWQNQAYFYLGKIEEKRNNSENAIKWLDNVKEGNFAFEADVTAISILAKDKNFLEANIRLRRMAEKYPKQKQRIALIEAELLSQQKEYGKAFDLLTRELKENPNQEDLLYSRALMADRMGRLDAMEADLRTILTHSPNNVEALNALGYGLADKTTRYEEAEKYLVRALRLKPDEAVILDSYGWLKYKMGDLDTALNFLKRAYDAQQENEIAAHLAEVLWVSGKREEAKKLYEKAVESAPDDIYLQNFKDKFLRLENNQ